jgi:hypothetical protein
LMGLENSFKFFDDVIDVMAQIKWLAKDTTYHDANVKKVQGNGKSPKKEEN